MGYTIIAGAPHARRTKVVQALKQRSPMEVDIKNNIIDAVTDSYLSRGVSKPWRLSGFFADISAQQKNLKASYGNLKRFSVNSIICAYVLSRKFSVSLSEDFLRELERVSGSKFFEKRVYFVKDSGNADFRRSSESLEFDLESQKVYRSLGFDPVFLDGSSTDYAYFSLWRSVRESPS